MEIQKINIKSDYKLPNIINDVETGILRIPQFQRKFVWEKSKVIKLLDSIYKEYPIGSFFFWSAPKKYYYFYRDIAELGLPKPDRYNQVSFIIDGQQRITSLYVTIKGLTLYNRDYSRICFDLDEERFVDHVADNQRFVSVKDLCSQKNFEIFNDLNEDRKKCFNRCVHRFDNYPFSAIDVRDKELDEVCDIFERINQGGRRLNLFDLIVASTWDEKAEKDEEGKVKDLRYKVEEENEKLDKRGFGEIDNEVFTQTLALIAKRACTRASQLQLRKEDVADYWKKTIKAMESAMDYLRSNLGVVNYQFIPYRGMISLVAYLFYKNKGRSLNNKQSEILSSWFWQSTFAERYSASTLTLITRDRKRFDEIAENKQPKINFPFSLEIDSLKNVRMSQKSAIKNGVLCLLALKHPLHLRNNSPLSLENDYFSDFNKPEKHHIFPKSLVQKDFSLAIVHSLPNFCFLPAELNKSILNKKPSQYFKDLERENPDFKQTLKTHLIEYNDSIKRDDYSAFLGSRATLILNEIYALTGSKAERVIASDANKAIDKTEELIRDLISQRLELANVSDLKNKIPTDVFGEIKRRMGEHIKKNPLKSFSDLSQRELLNFCDLMDYPKIILKNWDVFLSYYKSKSEVERRFISLKEYRNAIKHNRRMASFIRKEGEAAIEWLQMILESALEKEGQKNTVKQHLLNIDFNIKKIFQELVKQIKELGEVEENPCRSYIGYWNSKVKFLDIHLSQDQLVLKIRIQGYKLKDPRDLTRELDTSNDYWKGIYKKVYLTSQEQIPDVMYLVRQAYSKAL